MFIKTLLMITSLIVLTVNSLPKEYFTKNIQFIHSHLTEAQQNQTVYLFNIKQLTNNSSNVAIELTPNKSGMFTISQVGDLAFISLIAKQKDYRRVCNNEYQHSYILEVTIKQGFQVLNSVQLNVSILNDKTCASHAKKMHSVQMNIEYIFQVDQNESSSNVGVIKTDLPRNGIVAIVKVANENKESLDVVFTTKSQLVSIKKFLPNFYMIRLAKNLDHFENRHDVYEIQLQAIASKNRAQLDKGVLRFKIASSSDLNIHLKDGELNKHNSSFTGQLKFFNYFTSLSNSQAFIYQIKASLSKSIFNSDQDYSHYVENNIHYSLESNSGGFKLNKKLGCLTLISGELSGRFILNITVSDTKKLFKAVHFLLTVDILNIAGNERALFVPDTVLIQRSVTVDKKLSLIAIDLNEYESLSAFTRLEKCWVNGRLDYTENVFIGLNNKVFNSFDSTATVSTIYCKLTSPNVAIKVYVKWNRIEEITTAKIAQKTINFNVNTNNIVFDLKKAVTVESSNDYQVIYAFNKAGTDELYCELLNVNSLSGLVSGSIEKSSMLPNVLVKLSFHVQVVSLAQNLTVGLDIGSDTSFLMQKTTLLASKAIDIYLNPIIVQAELSDFDSQLQIERFSELDGQLFNVKVTRFNLVNGNVAFKVLDLTKLNLLAVEVVEALEIGLGNSLEDKIQENFIVEGNEVFYQPGEGSKQSNLYFMTIKACGIQCRTSNITLAIKFSLGVSQIQFSKPFYTLKSSAGFIDLKDLVLGHQFFNFERLEVRFEISNVDLNPLAGILFLKKALLNKKVTVKVCQFNKVLTSTQILIKGSEKLPNTLNSTIFISRNVDTATVDIIQLPISKRAVKIICEFIDQEICRQMLTHDYFRLVLNGSVLLKNIGHVFSTEGSRTISVLLKYETGERYEVKVNVVLGNRPHSGLSGLAEGVKVVSADMGKVLIPLTAYKGEEIGLVQPRLLRVKNMVANAEAIGFDFKIIMQSRNYFIDVKNLKGIQLDQLFSFDFIFGSRYFSFYFVRTSNVPISRSVKTLVNDSYVPKMLFDMATTNLSSFEQAVYVFNKVDGDVRDCFEIRDSELWLNTQQGLHGTEKIHLTVTKFLIENISLRITQVENIHVVIEIRKPSAQQSSPFYKQIQIRKSMLHGGLVIYNLNKSSEMQVVSERQVPFEIRESGVVFIGAREGTEWEFDVVDSNGQGVITFEVNVVNDEPIVALNGLEQKIYVSQLYPTGAAVDQVNLSALDIPCEPLNNELTFRLLQHASGFQLNEKNGLLLVTNEAVLKKKDYFNLNVRINGTCGLRRVLVNLHLLVIVKSEIKSQMAPFLMSAVYFTRQFGNEEKFPLASSTQENVRYKVINNVSGCHVHWVNGNVTCKPSTAATAAMFHVIKYNLKTLNLIDCIRVSIGNGKQESNVINVNNSRMNINVTIKLNGSMVKQGDVLSNIRDVIEEVDLQSKRFFFIQKNSKLERFFSLNEKNGQLIVTSPIDNNIQTLSARVSLACLDIKSGQYVFRVIKLIRVKVELTWTKQISEISELDLLERFQFGKNLNPSNQPINIDLPLLSSYNHPLRIVQLNKNSSNIYLEIKANNPNLFLMTNQHWLILEKQFLSSFIHHSVDLIAVDSVSMTSKTKRLNFRIVPMSSIAIFTMGSRVLNLRKYFVKSYEFLVLNDTRYMTYNAKKGIVQITNEYTNKNIAHSVQIKLFSVQSDIIMGEIRLKAFLDSKKATKRVNLAISKAVKVGSVIYNSRRRIKSISSSSGSFKLDASQHRVIVAKDLHDLDKEYYMEELEMNKFNIVLHVKVLENVFETIEFKKANFFFTWDRASNQIGQVSLSDSNSIVLRIVDQLQINQIKCVSKGFTSSAQANFYTKSDRIFVNKSTEVDFCEWYELDLAAKITSNLVNRTKTIQTTAYVKMNPQKHQILKSVANFVDSYNKLVSVDNVFIKSSIFSIDLYKLGHLNSTVAKSLGLLFDAIQIDSLNSPLDFNLNNRNGLLLLKTKQKFKNVIERRRFLITIFSNSSSEVYSGKQFILNLYFQNKFTMEGSHQPRVFFKNSFTEIVLEKGVSSFDLNSILFNPLDLKKVQFKSQSNSFRVNESNLYLNKLNPLQDINIFNVTACHDQLCDVTTMIIRMSHQQASITSTTTSTSSSTTIISPTVTSSIEIKKKETQISSISPENMFVFITLVSLIIISGTVTSGTLIYLHRYQCLKKARSTTKSSSRKHLEISMSSEQNGSMSSEGSRRSLSCANRSLSGNTVITDFNSLQNIKQQQLNRQSKVSVCNLLASQLQDNYFQNNDLFSEFEMLKFTLNWVPSYDQFQTVINDFEKFPGANEPHAAAYLGAIYHDTDLNPYDQCDSQTFV